MYGQGIATLVLLVVGFNEVNSAGIPDYIQVCHRSDPEVENCIVNSIEKLRPKLKSGLPELDVPALEPLVLPLVNVANGQNGFTVLGHNIHVYGPSDFEIKSLKVDTSNENRLIVHLLLNLPRLIFQGEYEVNARLLSLPLKGRGPMNCNATNTKADIVLTAQIHKKGNHNYLRFNKIDMGLKIEDFKVRLDNLFNGDKTLGEAANQVLNENRSEFVDSVHPIVVKTASEIIIDAANKIAKNQPYDLLFPK